MVNVETDEQYFIKSKEKPVKAEKVPEHEGRQRPDDNLRWNDPNVTTATDPNVKKEKSDKKPGEINKEDLSASMRKKMTNEEKMLDYKGTAFLAKRWCLNRVLLG